MMRMRLAPIGLAMSLALLSGCETRTTGGPEVSGELRNEILSYDDLDGWEGDDHAAGLATFVRSCPQALELYGSSIVLGRICADAAVVTKTGARLFIEDRFVPILRTRGGEGLFTAYYEPELVASRTRTETFIHPIYAKPDDLLRDPTGATARSLPNGAFGPYFTRAEIMDGALDGRGLEMFWFEDPVEVAYLQIQGSGRIRLTDGSFTRVGFAAKNGHEWISVAKLAAQRGGFDVNQASQARVSAWVKANPVQGREVLAGNPSFVFFRELDLDPELGPLGAIEVPLTPFRSIAVDREFYGLGSAMMWLETDSPLGKLRRVMVAQDTGSAIIGPQRGDVFFGSGAEAGAAAGKMQSPGRMVLLVPVEVAEQVLASAE